MILFLKQPNLVGSHDHFMEHKDQSE